MWWEGWGGVCVSLYHTAQSVFSPIHHLLSLVPCMLLLTLLTTVSLFLLAAYGLTGLSRGGQQVSKCKEVFGKAVKLLVDLASLQVCILYNVMLFLMHVGWLLSSLIIECNGKVDKLFLKRDHFAQILCFHNHSEDEVILDAVQILPLTNTNPC